MSISEQLSALADNKAAIKAAIEAKNPSTPPTDALAQWPEAIKSIPDRNEVWTKPVTWPDIRPILDADTHQYTNKLIALLDADASMPSISLAGGTYYVLSDGYEGNGGTHAWDASKDIVGADGRHYRWGIVMSDAALSAIAPCTGTSYDTKVLWAYGPDANITITNSYPNYRMFFCESVTLGNVSQTSGNRIFSNMYSLRSLKAKSVTVVSMQQAFEGDVNLVEIDIGTFDTTACTSFENAFVNCYSLVGVPSFDSSHATTMANVFVNCCSLKSIPQLDASSCTNASSMFQSCRRLESLPAGFTLPDVCTKNRLYQDCVNLHKPLSRFVANGGEVVIFYGACSLESMGDYVDLRAVTNFSAMFDANSFIKTPSTLLVSASLNISSAYYRAEFKDRFADFDANGNLVGGLVYNINDVTGNNLMLTVGSLMKSFFTAEEQAAIVAAMSAKGWAISW